MSGEATIPRDLLRQLLEAKLTQARRERDLANDTTDPITWEQAQGKIDVLLELWGLLLGIDAAHTVIAAKPPPRPGKK
jgi:hypothetical protein